MDSGSTPQKPKAKGRLLGGTELGWHRTVAGGTGISVLALHLSRPIDPPSLLQSALQQILNTHPILRATFSSTSLSIPPSSHLQIQTLDSTQTSEILARVAGDDRQPSISPFHAILEHELNRNPWAGDPKTGPDRPACFATAYELSPGGPAVVALRLHTSVCDRASGAEILRELMGLMGKGEGSLGMAGEGELMPVIEDLIPKEDAGKSLWVRGKDIVAYSLKGLRSATLPFEDTRPDRSSAVVRLALGAEETRLLLSACKAKGVKLCGALSAAGLIAAYSSKHLENNHPETYSTGTLIDCRKYLSPALNEQHMGFYDSAIINTHRVHGGDGLWEVAVRCHDSYSTAMRNRKHLTDIKVLNFLMGKALDNPHLSPSSSMRTSLITVFEEPAVFESSELQRELGVEDYVGCASVHGLGPSMSVFDTIRGGKLDCAIVYPSPLHSRRQMTELVEHMKRILVQGSRV